MNTNFRQLSEVAQDLDVSTPVVVRAHKEGRAVNGYRIETHEYGETGTLWRAVPAANDTGYIITGQTGVEEEALDLIEQTTPHLDESGIHGRTLSALFTFGLSSLQDLVDFLAEPKLQSRKEVVDVLTNIDGVGEKGANDVIDWMESEGHSPVWDDCPHCGADAEGRMGVVCGECRRDVSKEYTSKPDATDVAEEFDIVCPCCSATFDTAPLGAYEDGEAQCLDPESMAFDGDETPGNCGARFWVSSTENGYTTTEILKTEVIEPAGVEDDQGDTEEPAATEGHAFSEDEEISPVVTAAALAFERPRIETVTVPFEERAHPLLAGCRLLGRAEHDTEAWYAMRSNGIGSSDVGAILGLSPFADIVDVWKTKMGEPKAARPWLDVYADFGTWFEPYLLEACGEQSGTQILAGSQLGTLRSASWEFALANIDGLDSAMPVIEELKTTSEKWTEVPAYYVAQVQHQMFVCDAPEARIRQFVCPIPRRLIQSLRELVRGFFHFPFEDDGDAALAAWLIEQGEIYTWIIERDDRFIEQMLERERDFWSHVESGIEPQIPDPEGTVDLTGEFAVLAAVEEWATIRQENKAFKPAQKAEEKAKKAARKLIEQAVGLLGDRPKRLTIGEHKATLVKRYDNEYWNLYDGETDDIAI